MSRTSFTVTGRITRKDTNAGVHGLRVEIWDDELSPDKHLGSGLTNRDGYFHIRFCLPDSAECCDPCPRVYVKVRDRDCRVIYDGCADRHCCEPGTSKTINLALAPETLWWHLARPLSWQRISEPLIPKIVFQEVEEAVDLLAAAGTPSSVADLSVAICATPAIEVFDRVLDDAWAALQGDLAAAARYRDILKALCAAQSNCCCEHAPFESEVENIVSDVCGEKRSPHDCKDLKPCEEPHPCDDGACGCSCDAPLVSEEKAIMLLMAALQVACNNTETAKRYLLALLDQLCRFEMLAGLHRASARAVLGDKKSLEHVRDLFEFLCSTCEPGEHRRGCPVHRPLACCETCLDERLAKCLRQAVEAWCCIDCYCVSDVRPPRACPGDEIVIIGKGFGDESGTVVFRQSGGVNAGPSVEPKSWCDDRITVVVPQGAGCGLWLLLPPETIEVCGRFLELRRTGCIEKGFEGTSAEILRFGVKGHVDGECIQPGEPLRIRWKTCATDNVKIDIINAGTGTVIASLDPADPSGQWDFTATNFKSTVRLRVQITATGKCEPRTVTRQVTFVIQKRPSLSIQGLEVTQSIQYYRANQHLTDPADRGPDNTLRLVTNKTAWVRAYLRSGQDPGFDNGQLPGVEGTLTVERRVGGVWGIVANMASQNGPIAAEDAFASYDAERSNINTTLNFIVPAGIMTGLLRFSVNVASSFPHCPGNTASRSTQVDVNLTQTLNAAFITIGYNGPDNAGTGTLNLPAPTLAQCQAETSWAMTTYPVSGTPNVRAAGTFVTNTPLNDPRSCPGCCSPNWGLLLPQVAALVALDQAANPGTTWVYYGLINGGIPVNVPGCNGWGATGGLAGAPVTYAHEIGHQFGLPHARCGNAGAGNAAYPVYEPYDLPVDPPGTSNWTMASIGEYGLDINNGDIANPIDFEDFMSYCGPRWMSAFTYAYLTNIAGLTPVVIPTGSGAAARVITDEERNFERDETAIVPLIHILGSIDVDGKVEVVSVARLDTRYFRGFGRETGYIAQLLDAYGQIIAQDHLYSYPTEGCESGPGEESGCSECKEKQPILFKAMVNDVAPGSALRIVKRGEVVWERKGADKPPAFAKVTAEVDKDGALKLTWGFDRETKEHTESAEVWVRWTNDDGRTWHALTVGQRGSSVTIEPAQLPSGYIRFQLLASDGFHTVTAVSEPVNLPAKPPAVTIQYPRASSRVYEERQIHLFGTASSYTGNAINPEKASW
ncbi:MAG TPA: hypothetical protein VLG74_11060, partial [Blastocatellia bacterium]|nr:hypothetical protein [Blastocatellia bacterium]